MRTLSSNGEAELLQKDKWSEGSTGSIMGNQNTLCRGAAATTQ